MPTKTERTFRVIKCDAPALFVSITVGGETDRYCLIPFDSDWGEAWRVTKLKKAGETYDVCIDGDRSLCDCKGFLHRGACRHVAVLQALYERGAIKPRTEAPKGDAWEGETDVPPTRNENAAPAHA